MTFLRKKGFESQVEQRYCLDDFWKVIHFASDRQWNFDLKAQNSSALQNGGRERRWIFLWRNSW
ncbi:MAG: hypothetical protein AB7K37_16905 [Cyclobacteriaceae bacterium]